MRKITSIILLGIAALLGASCSRDSQTPPTEKASKIFGVKITDDEKQNITEMTKVFGEGSDREDVLKKLNDIAKSRDDCTVTVFNRPDGSSAVDFNIETPDPAAENVVSIFNTMFIFSKEKKLVKISPTAGLVLKPDSGPPPPVKNKDVVEAPPKEKAFKIFGVKPTTGDYLQNYNEMTKAFPIGSSEDDVLKRLNDIVKARSDCRIMVDHLDDEMTNDNDAGAMIITFDIASTKTFRGGKYEILRLSFYFTTEKKLFDIVAGTMVTEAVGNESTETKPK